MNTKVTLWLFCGNFLIWSMSLETRVFLELLLALLLPCRVWLLMPPRPHVKISEVPIGTPVTSLLGVSTSLSSPSALLDGSEDRLHLFCLLGLTSCSCSSLEDESLPTSLVTSSSSFSESCGSNDFLRLPLRFLVFACDLLVNTAVVALAVVRFFPNASSWRWDVWAIEAWICEYDSILSLYSQ